MSPWLCQLHHHAIPCHDTGLSSTSTSTRPCSSHATLSPQPQAGALNPAILIEATGAIEHAIPRCPSTSPKATPSPQSSHYQSTISNSYARSRRCIELGRGLALAKPYQLWRTAVASSSTLTCPCFYPWPSLHRRAPSLKRLCTCLALSMLPPSVTLAAPLCHADILAVATVDIEQRPCHDPLLLEALPQQADHHSTLPQPRQNVQDHDAKTLAA